MTAKDSIIVPSMLLKGIYKGKSIDTGRHQTCRDTLLRCLHRKIENRGYDNIKNYSKPSTVSLVFETIDPKTDGKTLREFKKNAGSYSYYDEPDEGTDVRLELGKRLSDKAELNRLTQVIHVLVGSTSAYLAGKEAFSGSKITVSVSKKLGAGLDFEVLKKGKRRRDAWGYYYEDEEYEDKTLKVFRYTIQISGFSSYWMTHHAAAYLFAGLIRSAFEIWAEKRSSRITYYLPALKKALAAKKFNEDIFKELYRISKACAGLISEEKVGMSLTNYPLNEKTVTALPLLRKEMTGSTAIWGAGLYSSLGFYEWIKTQEGYCKKLGYTKTGNWWRYGLGDHTDTDSTIYGEIGSF